MDVLPEKISHVFFLEEDGRYEARKIKHFNPRTYISLLPLVKEGLGDGTRTWRFPVSVARRRTKTIRGIDV